jgi:hypothetical protein
VGVGTGVVYVLVGAGCVAAGVDEVAPEHPPRIKEIVMNKETRIIIFLFLTLFLPV